MQHEDEMLDVQSVADLLQVNPRTVLRMVEREELPAIRVARRSGAANCGTWTRRVRCTNRAA